jgi:hypothetical protein
LTRRRGVSREILHNSLRKGHFRAISTNVENSLKWKVPQAVIASNAGICVSAVKLVASIFDPIDYQIHRPINNFAGGTFDTCHGKGEIGGRVNAIADFGWWGSDK